MGRSGFLNRRMGHLSLPLESQMSHEKNPGWMGYIGDDILPSYIGIIINHEIRIPFLTNQFHGMLELKWV